MQVQTIMEETEAVVVLSIPPIENLKDLIHKHAWGCFRRLPTSCRMGYEDLVQEGRMKYVELSDKFDPTRGVKFITYFFWGLKNHFIGIVQKDYKQHKTDPRQGYTEFLRKRREAGVEDIVAEDDIQGRITDMFTERLSRDAFRFVRELLGASDDFLTFEEGNYKRHSDNPKMLRNRIFKYLGWNGSKRQSILEELKRKFVGDGWKD